MFSKPKTLVVVAAFTLVTTGDLPIADAQGILQRLGDRIRSRVNSIPSVPPRTTVPPTTVRPASPIPPAGAANPDGDPSRYNQPQRPGATDPQARTVSPINSGGPNPNGVSPAQGKVGEPSPLPQKPAALPADRSFQPMPNPQLENEFGDSILSQQFAPNDSANITRENPNGRKLAQGRASIGIRVLDPRPNVPRVRVVSFNGESRADEAGMRVGDAILAIDGVATPTISAIAAELSERRPGEVVRVHVGRENQTMLLPVLLVSTVQPARARAGATATSSRDAWGGPAAVASSEASSPERPANEPQASDDVALRPEPIRPSLGIDVEEPKGSRGAMVVAVDPNSPADLFGIKVGDRIVAVDHRFVVDTSRLEQNLSSRKDARAPLRVKLVREDELVDLVIHFDGTAPPSAANELASNSDSGKSILGGLGSTLGGFLGGKKSAASKTEADQPVAALKPKSFKPKSSLNLESSDLPSPLPMPKSEPTPLAAAKPISDSNIAVTRSNRSTDSLDFGDSEPINQVIFEDARTAVEKPSLANKTAGTKKKSEKTESESDVLGELRAEILRLQQRLETLEKAKNE